jgi:prepilin-type N-terminal cleavage/methylation domain-containing protein
MKHRGFTVIELLVVITIIGILAGILIIAYNGVQQNARDSKRAGVVTTIDEALEKYYLKNGEYPSVRNLVNSYAGNTGSAVASLLNISSADIIMPQMPSTATNPLTSTTPPPTDYITYTASDSVNNANCQSSTTGGCNQFTLTYIKENGGSTAVTSRHNPSSP